MIQHSLITGIIWGDLKYEIGTSKGDNEDGFTCRMSLKDKTLNGQMYDELTEGIEQIMNLNRVEIYKLDEIVIDIDISDPSLLAYISKCQQLDKDLLDCLFGHLNYCMLCNYLKLEDLYPLVFSFYSRLAYIRSNEIMPSIQESLIRTVETKDILKQGLIVGFLKQISRMTFKQIMSSIDKRQGEKRRLMKAKEEALRFEFFQASL
ncbi:hypothetical protein CANARDRAFT_26524 [[Candida] arabinofermentans NRRL YB-2248]|uniref:Uncharacterized protein n=1 Tax=[Candida] arabinofermentans NRRL YB-2248 TaxID=983967 RepID=A0A1E4T5U6_9ASCO|nr:hypothetical protein CANARDRAFT_26524 [[Candida] arabinofermentans NRRL YB-2248]